MSSQTIDISQWPWYGIEQMGTKVKRWVLNPDDPKRRRWLFKERRNDHGEDWSDLPHPFLARLGSV